MSEKINFPQPTLMKQAYSYHSVGSKVFRPNIFQLLSKEEKLTWICNQWPGVIKKKTVSFSSSTEQKEG